MESDVRTYKRRYDRELRHVKLILMQERRRMPVREWLELVETTRHLILSEPGNFFGPNLPGVTMLSDAVNQVFQGFLEDQRLLANQTSKRFRIPTELHCRR